MQFNKLNLSKKEQIFNAVFSILHATAKSLRGVIIMIITANKQRIKAVIKWLTKQRNQYIQIL